MARFYSINLQWALDRSVHLVREWGRIGSPGTVRCDPYDSAESAEAEAHKLIARKRRKGYA
jgi:predicted DNA-binding WGR domain protein